MTITPTKQTMQPTQRAMQPVSFGKMAASTVMMKGDMKPIVTTSASGSDLTAQTKATLAPIWQTDRVRRSRS